VVVTGDSASTCTEACASGRPVFLFRPAAGVPAKLARLHGMLSELGHLHPLGAPWPEICPPPLEPAAAVAEAILERWPRPIDRATGEAVASAAQRP
jgi:mitochondrial fission protein ELM1